jgi:hypothetical protein
MDFRRNFFGVYHFQRKLNDKSGETAFTAVSNTMFTDTVIRTHKPLEQFNQTDPKIKAI